MLTILTITYWTVLIAELIGDKAIYTVASLATRYRPANVYLGITIAFMGKMLAAVLFGQVLVNLPIRVTAAISAITFFFTAYLLWRKQRKARELVEESRGSAGGGIAVAFAAIFLSEWADVGQIAAAALAVQYRMPEAVWAGATAAMMTKGLLALTLGVQLRRYVPNDWLRIAAVTSCAILGLVAMGEAVLE
jgi:putative Ca2+/H+ antiporter (TMEM165/GDT1 family)